MDLEQFTRSIKTARTKKERAVMRASFVRDSLLADKPKGEWRYTQDSEIDILLREEPALIYDKEGNPVGVDAYVYVYDKNGNELKVDPHRICINPPTMIVDRENISINGQVVRSFKYDPKQAFFQWLVGNIKRVPNEKRWRTRGTVTTFFGDSADAQISSQNAKYSTARSGGTLSTSGGTTIRVGQDFASGGGGIYTIFESVIAFDTSSIDDDDNIDSVVLSLNGSLDRLDTNFTLEARLKSWLPSATTADWVAGASLGSLTLLASRTTTAYSSNYFTLTSTADFVSNINKTGNTEILLNSSRHRGSNTPTGNEFFGFSSAETSGTSVDPMLEVTHSPSATQYEQGVTGISGNLSGGLAKRTGKSLSGVAGSLSGTISRAINKGLSGTSGSITGALNKATSISLSGTAGSLTGALTTVRVYLIALSGSVGTLTGSLTKSARKSLAGSPASLSGSLNRLTSKNLSGTMGSLSGALTTAIVYVVSLAGTMGSLSGSLSKQINKSISGAAGSLSGLITKQTKKSLAGSVGTLSGALSTAKVKLVSLAGSITMSGSLTTNLLRTYSRVKLTSGYVINKILKSGNIRRVGHGSGNSSRSNVEGGNSGPDIMN